MMPQQEFSCQRASAVGRRPVKRLHRPSLCTNRHVRIESETGDKKCALAVTTVGSRVVRGDDEF